MAMIDTERYAQELSKLRETVEKAADALQIKRQTLQHKLKKYHISVL